MRPCGAVADLYLIVKFLHIATAIIALGTSAGLGILLELYGNDPAHGVHMLRAIRRCWSTSWSRSQQAACPGSEERQEAGEAQQRRRRIQPYLPEAACRRMDPESMRAHLQGLLADVNRALEGLEKHRQKLLSHHETRERNRALTQVKWAIRRHEKLRRRFERALAVQ